MCCERSKVVKKSIFEEPEFQVISFSSVDVVRCESETNTNPGGDGDDTPELDI